MGSAAGTRDPPLVAAASYGRGLARHTCCVRSNRPCGRPGEFARSDAGGAEIIAAITEQADSEAGD